MPSPDRDADGLALADVVSRLRRAMRRAARAYGSGGVLPGGLSIAQLEFLSCLAENPSAKPGGQAAAARTQLRRDLGERHGKSGPDGAGVRGDRPEDSRA